MNLAICGLMKAGKDTAADYILGCGKYGPGFITKFADPIYNLQAMIYKEMGLTLPPDGKDRNLLQLLGTEWGRQRDPNIWVNKWEKNLKEVLEGPTSCTYAARQNVIVTDMRFPNELKALQKLGFRIIYVWADEEIRLARGAKSIPNHESERMMTQWEGEYLVNEKLPDAEVIENCGSLEEFHTRIDTLLIEVLAK
jgi:dephospho-CoA kinase